MRDFFKFAVLRQIENVVTAIVQIVTAFSHGTQSGISGRYAGKRDRFFRLNDMRVVLQDRRVCHIVLVIIVMCRVLRRVGRTVGRLNVVPSGIA